MQVVGVVAVDVVAVGVDGVGGDQDIGQVEVVEQCGECGDLAAFLLDRDLPEDRTTGLVEYRHQMRLSVATIITAPVLGPVLGPVLIVTVDGQMGAAHGLAVHGQDPALLAGRHPIRRWCLGKLGLDPDPHRGLDRDRVQIGQNRRMVQACGTTVPTPSRSRMVWPVSWAYSAIAANERAPVSTAHAPNSRIAATPWRIPRALRGSGTAAKASTRDNATAGTVLTIEGDLRVIEGGNDRGDLQCGHGLPDVIKDLRPGAWLAAGGR
jgi:hypothetical protein